jgi:hypothetical protein
VHAGDRVEMTNEVSERGGEVGRTVTMSKKRHQQDHESHL